MRKKKKLLGGKFRKPKRKKAGSAAKESSEKILGLEREELFSSGHRACAGCAEVLVIRHVLKAAGKNTIAVSATGCGEVVSSPYPETAWKIPWIHGAFENAPAIASGIDEALIKQGKRNGINLVVFGGDGATFDIGLQSLSGAIERNHKFLYVCTDNEAYMNTGVQRSGATPLYAATTTTPAGKEIHGKILPKKPLPYIIASHGVKYVATVSPSHLQDLNKKVKKALEVDGPGYVHAICSCPTGWGHQCEESIELCRLAVETGVFPLYEIENGKVKFSVKPEKLKPVEDYLIRQKRFKHLTESELEKVQKHLNGRYQFLSDLEKKGKVFDVIE